MPRAVRAAEPNWLGTFKIDDSCEPEGCCCFTNTATITRLPDNLLHIETTVAGSTCQGLTKYEFNTTYPKDKNGFQTTIDILGTPNRFRLSEDSNCIACVNLQVENTKCSANAARIQHSGSNVIRTYRSLVIGAVLLVLMMTFIV